MTTTRQDFSITKLQGSDDWFNFIEDVESAARTLEVWQFVKPADNNTLEPALDISILDPGELDDPPDPPSIKPPPDAPDEPMYEDEIPDDPKLAEIRVRNKERKQKFEEDHTYYMVKIKDWNSIVSGHHQVWAIKKSIWDMKAKKYDEKKRRYEKTKDKIASLHREVIANMSTVFQEHCKNSSTLRGKLEEVRKRINPMHNQESYDQGDKLRSLLSKGGSKDWDNWSHQVEKTFTRCIRLGSKGIDDESARREFFKAIVEPFPHFHVLRKAQADDAIAFEFRR